MNLSQALEHFIKSELRTAVLYEKIAEISPMQLEKILLDFRNEELKHAEKLKEFTKDIVDVELGVRAELLFMKDSGYGEKNYTNEELKFSTRKEFFIFALQGEKDSILSYIEFKELLPKDSKVFKMVEIFIEEERNHMYHILKMIHDLK